MAESLVRDLWGKLARPKKSLYDVLDFATLDSAEINQSMTFLVRFFPIPGGDLESPKGTIARFYDPVTHLDSMLIFRHDVVDIGGGWTQHFLSQRQLLLERFNSGPYAGRTSFSEVSIFDISSDHEILACLGANMNNETHRGHFYSAFRDLLSEEISTSEWRRYLHPTVLSEGEAIKRIKKWMK